jgi:hypothetical protein
MYDSDLIPAKKVWYEMCQLNKHGLRTICLLLAIACFGLAIFVFGRGHDRARAPRLAAGATY